MSLQLLGHIELPEHVRSGGFDHGAVHRALSSFYVAHTANDALDVLNSIDDRYLHSIPRLSGVAIPDLGPHGLDFDVERRRLFCACDAKRLVFLEADSGEVLKHLQLDGPPDVIFFNLLLRHLDVAIGDPGLVEVFDTERLKRIETIQTEPGAHTIGFDAERNKLYAFLPETHRAAVYADKG